MVPMSVVYRLQVYASCFTPLQSSKLLSCRPPPSNGPAPPLPHLSCAPVQPLLPLILARPLSSAQLAAQVPCCALSTSPLAREALLCLKTCADGASTLDSLYLQNAPLFWISHATQTP